MIVKIIIGPLNFDLQSLYYKDEDEFIIGVDQGCQLLLDAGIKMDLAIGDFDSIDKNILQDIKENSEIKTYPTKKDFTDSYIAVKEALKMNPDDIIIYGGIGGRLDHTYANLKLLQLGPITMINNNTKTYMLDPGKYQIDNSYDYVSFFAIEDVKNLSLHGFDYELDSHLLTVEDPLCISNQGEGTVSFTEGLLLVIHNME